MNWRFFQICQIRRAGRLIVPVADGPDDARHVKGLSLLHIVHPNRRESVLGTLPDKAPAVEEIDKAKQAIAPDFISVGIWVQWPFRLSTESAGSGSSKDGMLTSRRESW